MLTLLLANLRRQDKALELLSSLLEAEFAALTQANPVAVSGVEMSVQELMRQFAKERLEAKSLTTALVPGAERLAQALPSLPGAEAAEIRELLESIDAKEQRAAKLGSRNYQVALGLFDQSVSYLDFFRKSVAPKPQAYGASGRMSGPGRANHVQPKLISGRM